MNNTVIKHFFILCALVILNACSDKPANSPQPKHLPTLKTSILTLSKIAQEVKFDGMIEAVNQATVSAQISGLVVELPVDVGDFVKKGELIVRLTDVEQKARAESTQAKFEEAQAQYLRMQDLLTKKLIAKADFDKVKSAFETAKALLKEANETASHTAIYAPYAGIVVSRSIKVGEIVAPGTPLLTGLSLEQLRVKVDIPQQHIGSLRLYKQARVLLPGGEVLQTKDLRIPPSADVQTHSFKVLVNLPNSDHALFPGTLVKIAFVNGETERLLVPVSAVAKRGEVNGVYVISGNTIDFRLVRLGSLTSGNRYPVLAGLQVGDEIAQDPIAATNAYKQSHLQTLVSEKP